MTSRTYRRHLGMHGLSAVLGLLLGASLLFFEAAADRAAVAALVALAVAASAALGAWREVRAGQGGSRPVSGPEGAAPVAGLARRDALTGLLNRHAWLEHLETVSSGERRSDRRSAVLLIDLTGLGRVNATLGFAAGDLLLRHMGARLAGSIRDSDLLARVAGDRFAIVQTAVLGPDDTAALCERIMTALDEPFDLFGHLSAVGIRVGVALYPDDGADPEQLMAAGAAALARAKADGSRIRFHDRAIDGELQERRTLQRDLASALEREQLQVLYRPQIDLASRRMVGVEASLCWHHPELGLLGADRFLPLPTELLAPTALWLLEQSCAHGVGWQSDGRALGVALDARMIDLRRPDAAGLVGGALARTGLAPQRLTLELGGGEVQDDALLASLNALRQLGVRLAVRGLGTQHGALDLLRRVSFDTLKLEAALVAELGHDASAAALVGALLGLGRSFGLETVAEGVRSAAHLEILSAADCQVAAGDYFSPPVDPGTIDAALGEAFMPHKLPAEYRVTI